MIEWLGHSAQDQSIPVSSPDCTHLHVYSPVQLDLFIKGRAVCGLPVIHAPKRPLGSLERAGESP
jgi:hypothetical protein